MIRSLSGEIDSAYLLFFHQFLCRIYLDNGILKNRLVHDLNDYTCIQWHRLYILFFSGREKDLVEAKRKNDLRPLQQESEIGELSMLPPCVGNLSLQTKRSKHVAYIYKDSNQLLLNLLNIEKRIKDSKAVAVWMKDCVPQEYTKLMSC